jgi:hypothetical protein
MPRSAGVVASAVLTLLASALTISLAGVAFAARHEMPPEAPGGTIAVSVMTLFLVAGGVTGIATGVYLLRLRHWARTSLLIFAGAVVAFGTFSMLLFLTPQFGDLMASVPNGAAARRVVLAGYAVPTAIGIWWLILFTRPGMKERFTAGRPAEPSAVPVSIAVIGWFLLLGGLTSLALWYVGLTFSNGLIITLVPSFRARQEEYTRTIVPNADDLLYVNSTAFRLGLMLLIAAVVGLICWLLVKHKGAFQQQPAGHRELAGPLDGATSPHSSQQ